jgi:hypothetical protein
VRGRPLTQSPQLLSGEASGDDRWGRGFGARTCVECLCGALYQKGIPINRVESKGNNPGDAVWSCLLSNAVDRGQWQCPVSRASCLCFCLCAGCCCGDGCACRRVSDSLSELSPLDVVVRPYFRLLFLPWGFITCVLQPRSDQIAISTFRGSRPRIA